MKALVISIRGLYTIEGELRVQVPVSPMGGLIIQRYDRSSWRVGLLQFLYSLKGARQIRGQGRNCSENIGVLKQLMERSEEMTTSPEGLSHPQAKRRSEWRWTRSVTMPQRRVYRSRRKGCRCEAIDSCAMGLAVPWYRRGETSVESSIPCSHGGESVGREKGRGGRECRD
ncbi:hypothetical protein BHM03_00014060 [Ensete ventricosum]|nr:hypothetical protein BHM03_00014060 [Ensete ventricosum]